MKALGIFVILVLIGLGYFLLTYHVVMTDSGKVLVKKQGMRFSEAFVDIRGWQSEDLDNHPRLADALLAAGHQKLVDKIDGVEELKEPTSAPAVGGLGGVTDPIIESQSPSGSQKTGGRLKDRARAAGGK
jgi:hypothetical protein